MHVFLRKSPLHRKHFFWQLKTADSSIACGTSTLKSLPSRVFSAPHVHLRLRKRLSRCTLDCGFQTSESPALRGFVGGPRALATAALYLAFIERPSSLEKLSCKVRLFAQNRSRIYRQKVTVTTLSPTTSHPDFQLLAQMAHIRFHGRKWVHTRLSEKNRTQGHTRRNRWRFGWGRCYYPRTVLRGSKTLRGRVSERQTLPLWDLGREVLSKNAESLRDSDALMRVAVPRRRGPAGLRDLFHF